MNLIEKIEYSAMQRDDPLAVRYFVRTSPAWPRIKTALKAAQDMDQALSRYDIGQRLAAAIEKFREAMNGAIGTPQSPPQAAPRSLDAGDDHEPTKR